MDETHQQHHRTARGAVTLSHYRTTTDALTDHHRRRRNAAGLGARCLRSIQGDEHDESNEDQDQEETTKKDEDGHDPIVATGRRNTYPTAPRSHNRTTAPTEPPTTVTGRMDDTRPPDETGTGNTPTDSWLELLQYAHASAHGHPHTKRAGDDPWPQRPRPRTHRIRRDAPERDWRPRPNTATGHTRFDSDDRHLHCGFGIRGTRAVTTETDYLETHTSPYLPEITATGHGWLETRTTPGEPPARPGPWLYALGRMLREMHQIEARKPLLPGVPLTALQRVCGHETARRARRLLVPARRHPHVITHGDLHPGNITTRNGRHLLTVTGFDTVAAGAAERDTVAALLGLAPHTGIATLATVIRPAADPALLRDELLHTLDRLATHVGNRDPATPTRRRTLHHLASTLTNHPEIADELSERLTGTPN